MTYASYISSGLRQAAQTRESRVLFHYEKRREAMEKPGEHAEQTHSLDPTYIRQHTYYQALQHHYQSVMHHRQTLMAHHESLMEHHSMVQALYEEVLDAERGTPNQQQTWQNFHRELQNHHRMVGITIQPSCPVAASTSTSRAVPRAQPRAPSCRGQPCSSPPSHLHPSTPGSRSCRARARQVGRTRGARSVRRGARR